MSAPVLTHNNVGVGLALNVGTSKFEAKPSANASNQLALGTDNLLFVPLPSATALNNEIAARVAADNTLTTNVTALQQARGETRTTADVANANATANTLAAVTGLTFTVAANTAYQFTFHIPFTTAVSTTGSRWVLTGPASTSLIRIRSQYTLTSTTDTINTVAAYNLPAASNATAVVGASFATITGLITTGATSGTVGVSFASRVASSAVTAQAGAVVSWAKIT